jgi:dTDP-4-dehydrorhamnose reductase
MHFSLKLADSDDAYAEKPAGPLRAALRHAKRCCGAIWCRRATSETAAQGANFLRTVARQTRERTELKIVADQIGAPTSAKTIADAVTGLLAAEPQNLKARFERARG